MSVILTSWNILFFFIKDFKTFSKMLFACYFVCYQLPVILNMITITNAFYFNIILIYSKIF